MRYTVVAELDVARREQRQNVVFDLLDELAVGPRADVSQVREFNRFPVCGDHLAALGCVGGGRGSRLENVHPDRKSRQRGRHTGGLGTDRVHFDIAAGP